MMAIDGGLHNFEPWSSDEDDTRTVLTSSNLPTTPMEGRLNLDRFNAQRHLYTSGLYRSATRELLVTDVVILNHAQVTRTIPELAPSPNYRTTSTAPKFAASTSNTLGRSVSAEMVRRVLKKAGYNGIVARKKPLIGKRNRVKRLKSAKEHILRPQQFWNEVIFSDESKFNIFGSDGRRMVWRKPNTSHHHPKHTIPTVKHEGGSVMVLGCMAASMVGKLVFIDQIMHTRWLILIYCKII
ncbi:transposable element Tc1 transposase [Trichonephila clavipes]|nr:transposable element Tc1 transposase [Trichonephila clavipes]